MVENWWAIAESIARLRDERGWTQSELSARSGVSVATIRNTERAIGRRSRRTMQDLSRALGMPKDYLSEILTGRQPAGTADQVPSEPGPHACAGVLDDIVVKRLTELVVPHLNQIERQLHRRQGA
jgi:transcriptional regulator with XRE-family HTH domain